MVDSYNIYKVLFDHSLDAILLTAPDGNIYAANRAACEMLQRSEEEICRIGRNGLIDLTDTRLSLYLEERKSTGRFFGEITMIRKDGTKLQVELTTAVFADRNGQLRTSMIIRDITDRKKAEAFLRESETRFRGIFENSLLAISIADEEGRLIQVNSAYASMYGYENPELMLSEVSNTRQLYANPDIRTEVIRSLHNHGRMDPTEFEVIRRDGTRITVLVSAREIRDEEGKLMYNMALHFDITERKKAEKDIQMASQYTRGLIEASLDPLVTINAEGKITDVNKATEKVTGFSRNRLIGSDFSDYFTEPKKAREGYMRVFSKGQVKDYPLTILHKNRRTTPVLYNATLFKNEAGEVQGVFASARDITVRKKMEEKLQESKKLLEKLNRNLHDVWEKEKSEIAMNLHDDLGQKFTALYMDLAWIKSRMGVQSKAVSMKINEMQEEIDETIEGIKEISTFLRPAVLFDLGLVPAIISQLEKFEKQSGIQCSFSCNPEEMKIDNRLSLILFRIFQEALTNIARHSKATSTIVTLNLSKNKICMCIKDNGIGIEKNKINSLSSMGLAGMKERSNVVNGSVLIKGVRGIGTTIRVRIPIDKTGKDD